MRSNNMKSPSALKVLVVEDNLLDFELMTAALSAELKCDITLAMTAKEFKSQIEANCPDVIVSDSNFFAFDGAAALKMARENCPDVPFIFCSGAPLDNLQKYGDVGEVPRIGKEPGFQSLVAHIKQIRNG